MQACYPGVIFTQCKTLSTKLKLRKANAVFAFGTLACSLKLFRLPTVSNRDEAGSCGLPLSLRNKSNYEELQ